VATITIGRTLNSGTDSVTVVQGSPPWDVRVVNKLVPEYYDNIQLVYNANNDITTVQYLLGLTLVATLTLGYDGSGNLTSVVRT
jgi:hypothetical protein